MIDCRRTVRCLLATQGPCKGPCFRRRRLVAVHARQTNGERSDGDATKVEAPWIVVIPRILWMLVGEVFAVYRDVPAAEDHAKARADVVERRGARNVGVR